MSEKPHISICIPAHNRYQYFEEALSSALNQTYTNYDVIICDDSDGDQIRKLAESIKDTKLHYIYISDCSGLVQKLNFFLHNSSGQWLVFLGDDDILAPDYLQIMTTHIQNNPNSNLVRCRNKIINSFGNVARLDPPHKPVMTSLEFMSIIFRPESLSFCVNITGTLFAKETLIQRGGFEDFFGAWNTDRYAWALLASLGPVIYEPSLLCSIRTHSDSVSANTSGLKYAQLLDTSSQMQVKCQNLLQEMSTSASSHHDQRLLYEANQTLDRFIKHNRFFITDNAILSVLHQENINTANQIQIIKRAFDKLPVKPFMLWPCYLLLAKLPKSFRKLPLTIWRRLRHIKWKTIIFLHYHFRSKDIP